jgi:hypothetical protein
MVHSGRPHLQTWIDVGVSSSLVDASTRAPASHETRPYSRPSSVSRRSAQTNELLLAVRELLGEIRLPEVDGRVQVRMQRSEVGKDMLRRGEVRRVTVANTLHGPQAESTEGDR